MIDVDPDWMTVEEAMCRNKRYSEEAMKSSNGLEAPESLHIDAYYKGFHVGLTKRSTTAQIKPYITDAITAIDYLIEKGFVPSWNSETNKSFTQSVQPPLPVKKEFVREPIEQGIHSGRGEQETRLCRTHNLEMTKRVSAKTGKPYFAHITNEKICFGRGYPEEIEEQKYRNA